MRLLRLYLVVHDGSQAHNADMHVISLVGWMGPLMHLVSQRGAYSAERRQVYGHMNRCFKKKETLLRVQMVWSEHSRPIVTRKFSSVFWTSTVCLTGEMWRQEERHVGDEILKGYERLKRLSWFCTSQFLEEVLSGDKIEDLQQKQHHRDTDQIKRLMLLVGWSIRAVTVCESICTNRTFCSFGPIYATKKEWFRERNALSWNVETKLKYIFLNKGELSR